MQVQLQEPQSKNGTCLHRPLDKNIGQGMGMISQFTGSCHDVFKQVLLHVFSCHNTPLVYPFPA